MHVRFSFNPYNLLHRLYQCLSTTTAISVVFNHLIKTMVIPFSVPTPEIRCLNSEIAAVFDRYLEPRLKPEYLSVVGADDATCKPVKTVDVNYVTMRIPFTGCGTARRVSNIFKGPPHINMIDGRGWISRLFICSGTLRWDFRDATFNQFG